MTLANNDTTSNENRLKEKSLTELLVFRAAQTDDNSLCRCKAVIDGLVSVCWRYSLRYILPDRSGSSKLTPRCAKLTSPSPASNPLRTYRTPRMSTTEGFSGETTMIGKKVTRSVLDPIYVVEAVFTAFGRLTDFR